MPVHKQSHWVDLNETWYPLDLCGIMPMYKERRSRSVSRNAEGSYLVWRFTNDDLRFTISKKGGRPESTGILTSAVHVELSGSRKSSGKM